MIFALNRKPTVTFHGGSVPQQPVSQGSFPRLAAVGRPSRSTRPRALFSPSRCCCSRSPWTSPPRHLRFLCCVPVAPTGSRCCGWAAACSWPCHLTARGTVAQGHLEEREARVRTSPHHHLIRGASFLRAGVWRRKPRGPAPTTACAQRNPAEQSRRGCFREAFPVWSWPVSTRSTYTTTILQSSVYSSHV